MFSKLDFRPSPPLDGAAAAARRTFQSQPSSPATRFENKHPYNTKKQSELELRLGIQKRE
jgi:hypothetical protein